MVKTGATFADAAAEWLRYVKHDRKRAGLRRLRFHDVQTTMKYLHYVPREDVRGRYLGRRFAADFDPEHVRAGGARTAEESETQARDQDRRLQVLRRVRAAGRTRRPNTSGKRLELTREGQRCWIGHLAQGTRSRWSWSPRSRQHRVSESLITYRVNACSDADAPRRAPFRLRSILTW